MGDRSGYVIKLKKAWQKESKLIQLTGRRMDYDDPIFLGFMAAFRRNMELTASVGALGFIPWIPKILPNSWTGVDLVHQSVVDISKLFTVKKNRVFHVRTTKISIFLFY